MASTAQASATSTSAATSTTPPSRLASTEQIGKAIATAGVVVYVSGVIVVNTYLHQFGVSDFSVVKAKYIYTGALLCVLPFAILLAIALFRQWRATSILAADFFEGALGVIAFIVGAYLYLALHDGIPLKVALMHAAWLLVSAAAVVVAIQVVTDVAKIPLSGPLAKQLAIARQAALLLLVGICVIAFGWYVRQFARDVYPLIPDAFGGSKPRPVLLLLGKDSESVPELGILTAAGSHLSQHVTVLNDGEDFYTLRLKDGSIVQVKKDLIAGVKVVR